MTVTLDALHKDMVSIKKDIALIKSMVSENFELSDHAINSLKEARKTPSSKYVDLE